MENSKFKVIINGVTGMVGEGVLHECLLSPDVSEILIVSRKPSGQSHSKIKELILPDFMHPNDVLEQVIGYDACFFCLGVSSVGMKEKEYTEKTYDLTIGFAKALVKNNPNLNFLYISGSGTDTSEKGKLMWARVKGKTENDLHRLGLKASYAFRPAMIYPTKGLKNTLKFYKYINWLYPILRKFSPSLVCTLKELGQMMIKVGKYGYEKKEIEVLEMHQ